MEVRHCSTGHCPSMYSTTKRKTNLIFFKCINVVDCEWLEWEDWEPCSVPCGEGRQSRKRFKKPLQFGGKPCTGKQFEGRTCKIKNCPSKLQFRCIIINIHVI